MPRCHLKKMLLMICLIGPLLSVSMSIEVKEAYLQTSDGAMTTILPQIQHIIDRETVLVNRGNYVCYINMMSLIDDISPLRFKFERKMITLDEVNLILEFRCRADQAFMRTEIKNTGNFKVGIACIVGEPRCWRGDKIPSASVTPNSNPPGPVQVLLDWFVHLNE